MPEKETKEPRIKQQPVEQGAENVTLENHSLVCVLSVCLLSPHTVAILFVADQSLPR